MSIILTVSGNHMRHNAEVQDSFGAHYLNTVSAPIEQFAFASTQSVQNPPTETNGTYLFVMHSGNTLRLHLPMHMTAHVLLNYFANRTVQSAHTDAIMHLNDDTLRQLDIVLKQCAKDHNLPDFPPRQDPHERPSRYYPPQVLDYLDPATDPLMRPIAAFAKPAEPDATGRRARIPLKP